MCDLLVLSCDKFEDTHKIFFDLKRKYWKDCPYDTYLLTETIDSPYAKTIKKQGEWTKRVREALSELSSDYVIIMLDDFFIRDYVKQDKIDQIKFNNNTAVYNFEVDYNNRGKSFRLRKNKEPYLLSCQPSMWNRLKLIELLQKDTNPWNWELTTLDSPYEFYINTEDLIIDIGYYNYKQWSIKQGKWCAEIIPFFKKENIEVDYSIRGFYDMKLSIIIPIYNTTMLTKQLLDTLRPQLTSECELIVVDDGSTEDTSILGDIYHKKNGGVSSARNYGLSKAQGKYVVFIDSDDMITKDYIETILSVKEEFDYCYFGWKSRGRINGDFLITQEPPTWNTCVWNCVYKRDLIGNNRFDETKQIAEDEDFNKRVRKGKRANINKILYDYNSSREDSLTRRFAAGLIGKEVKHPQILLYQKAISEIGGVEKFIQEFVKEYHNYYDITLVYSTTDIKQLRKISQYIECIEFTGQKFVCDKYICVSNQMNIADNVTSLENFYADMIHADYTALNWLYKEHNKTNVHIAVSEVARKSFKRQRPKQECHLIYNLLKLEPTKPVLHLISAARMDSVEKGYNRFTSFVYRLNERNIPFIWQVFTERPKDVLKGVAYIPTTLDIDNHIKDNQFYISLSDTESWGYSTAQALELGVWVISTDYPAITEQGLIDNINGYLLKMDLSNLDEIIDKMISHNITPPPYQKKDDPKQWKSLLGKGQKSDYVYEDKGTYVECISEYTDTELGKHFTKGDKYFIKDKSRIDYLLGNNEIRTTVIKLLEEIQ